MARSWFGWWGASLLMSVTVLALPLAEPATGASQAAAQGAVDESLPQRFTAFAANLSNIDVGPAAQTIQIEITRWSTDGERDRLLEVLKERGPDALLDALQDLPRVGFIRTPTSLGYDLRFARQVPWGDGGRRIFIATDRYLNFWEIANQTRSSEYPFTLVEMHLNTEGRGEGKLSLATKVIAAGNELVLENYATQPILLKDIRRER